MKRWSLLSVLALFGCSYAPVDEGEAFDVVEEAIVGGTDANVSDHPWQVYMQVRLLKGSGEYAYFACGGSLLSDTWVVTAQHCLTFMDNGDFTQRWASPRDILFVAGTHDLTETGLAGAQFRGAREYIPYPGYDGNVALGGDAVLVRVHPPFDFSDPKVGPIQPLHEVGAENGFADPGVMATTTGWGRTSNGGPITTRLQELHVPIVDNSVAEAAYGFPLLDQHIAAGHMAGADGTCNGDSGGPLVVWKNNKPKLAGITSFGTTLGCATTGYPDVFTRVSAIHDWIATFRKTTLEEIAFIEIDQDENYFVSTSFVLPEGATQLNVELRNGQGDADLFVRHGSPVNQGNPYLTSNCFSNTYSSNEFCPIPKPAAGTWHVSLYTYTPIKNVKLVVNYRVPR